MRRENSMEPTTREQTEDSVKAITALALRSVAELKRLKAERKEVREQKRNLVVNDKGVSDIEYEMTDLTLKLKEAKAKISRTPEHEKLKLQDKELTEMINEVSEMLTSHLISYTNLTGSNIIEDDDGNELEIKHKVTVKSGQLKLF